MGRARNEIGGRKFGRLTVGRYLGREGGFLWACTCDCGSSVDCKSTDLLTGKVQSCGCIMRETTAPRSTSHGHAGRGKVTPEYRAYQGMKKRCYNPKARGFPEYGGRGIAVCDWWLDSFDHFLADVGHRPSPDHSIERIDNNGDYEPGNVRWATKPEQMRNRRSARMVEYDGAQMSLAEAAERAGVPYKVAQERITRLGWSIERALSTKTIGRWQ